ncbi:hypothetical protein B0H14DRAFT_1189254 [Mycena olivaceomarginata]|nr:hypothetical protein B0H14DRAFT_1189254 [Mycena olivaceomarginata]
MSLLPAQTTFVCPSNPRCGSRCIRWAQGLAQTLRAPCTSRSERAGVERARVDERREADLHVACTHLRESLPPSIPSRVFKIKRGLPSSIKFDVNMMENMTVQHVRPGTKKQGRGKADVLEKLLGLIWFYLTGLGLSIKSPCPFFYLHLRWSHSLLSAVGWVVVGHAAGGTLYMA